MLIDDKNCTYLFNIKLQNQQKICVYCGIY